MYKGLLRTIPFLALALLSPLLSGCPNPDTSPSDTPTACTLTIVSGPYGSATPAGAQTVESGPATSISASPHTGFVFVNWTVTSGTASLSNANSSTPTVTLSNGNATVQANFINPPGTHILTVAVTTGCTTTPSGVTVVPAGPSTNITALADAGYTMPGTGVWTLVSGAAVFTNADSSTTTVTLTSDATIQAHVIP
jgi:hypothetical protein